MPLIQELLIKKLPNGMWLISWLFGEKQMAEAVQGAPPSYIFNQMS